ncbi:MAG: hypothetical protein WDW38_000275 [Sanguina aurantia]
MVRYAAMDVLIPKLAYDSIAAGENLAEVPEARNLAAARALQLQLEEQRLRYLRDGWEGSARAAAATTTAAAAAAQARPEGVAASVGARAWPSSHALERDPGLHGSQEGGASRVQRAGQEQASRRAAAPGGAVFAMQQDMASQLLLQQREFASMLASSQREMAETQARHHKELANQLAAQQKMLDDQLAFQQRQQAGQLVLQQARLAAQLLALQGRGE